MSKKLRLIIGLLSVFAMLAAACGSDAADVVSGAVDSAGDAAGAVADTAGDAADAVADTAGDVADAAGDAMDGDDGAMDASSIGEGREITMARANWASGYIQAEIYKIIMEQMGYTVSSPSEIELAPDLGYQQMAEGEVDFWTNSWYPGHSTWWEGERSDGTSIGDHLVKVSGLFEDAGVQGFLATKTVIDDNAITSIQQINDDPALVALFDGDGNGKADLYGCPEDWTCDDITNNQILFYGWDNIEQIQAGYDAMFAQVKGLVDAGEPAMIYTWTPSSYVTELIPGDNVYWLSAHPTDVLDDSNPSGTEGGENHSQGTGFTAFGADTCTQPCQLGWEAADIQVTANKDWAEANPEAIKVMEQIRPSVIDISIAQVEQANGDGSQAHVEEIAAKWVADNQDLVDSWIAAGLG